MSRNRKNQQVERPDEEGAKESSVVATSEQLPVTEQLDVAEDKVGGVKEGEESSVTEEVGEVTLPPTVTEGADVVANVNDLPLDQGDFQEGDDISPKGEVLLDQSADTSAIDQMVDFQMNHFTFTMSVPRTAERDTITATVVVHLPEPNVALIEHTLDARLLGDQLVSIPKGQFTEEELTFIDGQPAFNAEYLPDSDSLAIRYGDVPQNEVSEPDKAMTPDPLLESNSVGEITPTSDMTPQTPSPHPGVDEEELVQTSTTNSSDELSVLDQATARYDRGVIGWSDTECQAYLDSNKVPEKTPRGSWVYDRFRLKDLRTLTQAEVFDFMDDLLKIPASAVEQIWEEIYHRFNIPYSWYCEDTKIFLNTTVKPETTSGGILVRDRLRDLKGLSDWTYPEVRAAILGEIKTHHTQEALLNRVRSRLELSAAFNKKHLLKTIEEEFYANMSESVISAKLVEFKYTRESNASTPQQHGQAYVSLYKALTALFKYPSYNEFKEAWTVVLDFVKREENGLFNAKRRFAHWEHLPLEGKEAEALESLITFLVNVCSPDQRRKATRKYLEAVAGRICRTEEQAQYLYNYHTAK